ncbi:gallate dioxygenase [Brevundimonas sp.]|uniref:gallate dioxygenase n=1 Tax=Brevundimonas sp. TaxID=1871086 RepID=UPI002625E172|nr:gallate dioxygenase [Brevundimonas sp.]
MATIIGGIGTSHVPTIGVAYDKGRSNDPAWAPLFEGYKPVAAWLAEHKPDALIVFYNDHASQFFFDRYPTFALGIADEHPLADEGSGLRPLPSIKGWPELSSHLLDVLVEDEFDITVIQDGALDHGCHSPLPLLWPHVPDWPGAIIPIAINVLHFPLPTANRCYRLGQSIRRAVQSFAGDARIAVVGTGGLSHQVHGERTGFNNEGWDTEFLDLIRDDPEALTRLRHADYIVRGGAESVEMIMWLAMRGALGGAVHELHRAYYLATTTAMAVTLYEPTEFGDDADQPSGDGYEPGARERAGLDGLEGTYVFDSRVARASMPLNRFLWQLTDANKRVEIGTDWEAAMESADLGATEREMIRARDWIGLIHQGANFFLLEKLARVSGVPNLEMYAQMRGEEFEEFMQTRRVPDAR